MKVVGLPTRLYQIRQLFYKLGPMVRWLNILSRQLEMVFWFVALVGLYFLPDTGGHFTLCPIAAMGFTWCPGCGLGHALHDLLHGHVAEALRHHYLVLFAFFTILFRMFKLIILNRKIEFIHDRR